jgi:signal transduction histidine kinase
VSPRGGRILLEGRPADEAVELVISDEGPGIPSEVSNRLFEPFFTTKPHGTGLGLWLSQRIIRDHGGTIAAESEAGKGTTFIITLPAIVDSAEKPGLAQHIGRSGR